MVKHNKGSNYTSEEKTCEILAYFPPTNTPSNAFSRYANSTFAAWLEVVTKTINFVYMRHTDEKCKVYEERVRCTSYKSLPWTYVNVGVKPD